MNKPTIINGSCHCGNIKYLYKTNTALNEIPLRKCNCSFCSKQGAIYTSDPNGELTVKIETNTHIEKYQFSSEHVNFIFCSKCGVMPLSTTIINKKLYALININTVNESILTSPVIENNFNTETVNESIKRRKLNWISKIQGV